MARELVDAVFYLLAIVNPISKVFVLSVLGQSVEKSELRKLSFHSSIIGMLILLLFAAGGKFILSRVFHVELHSFQLAGGIVLTLMGYRALSKGVFFEMDDKTKLKEISIVPLASPMIAGPGTITIAVGLSVENGLLFAFSVIVIAILVNLLVMLVSDSISKALLKFNFMGALIRITGLIVMTMGVEMVLEGVDHWLETICLRTCEGTI